MTGLPALHTSSTLTQDSSAIFHPCYFSSALLVLTASITLQLFIQLILLPLLPHFLHPRTPHAWFLLPSVFSKFFPSSGSSGVVIWGLRSVPLARKEKVPLNFLLLLQVVMSQEHCNDNFRSSGFAHHPRNFLPYTLSLADPFCLLYSQDLTSFLHIHVMESLSAPLKQKIIIATCTSVSGVSSLPHFHQPPTPVGSVLQKMSNH